MVKVTLKCASKATKRALKPREFTGKDHISAIMSMANFLCQNPNCLGTKMDITEEKEEGNA